jgi:hypothetical protein
MKKMILLILYFVAFIECNKYKISEICYPKARKKIECHGQYNYNCNNSVCTKNKYTCEMMSLFSGLKGEYLKKYKSVLNVIKKCPEPPINKWKPNDVCLNTKDCVSTLMSIWSFNRIKQKECKCRGKYDYRCNQDYCALNKRACERLKKNINGIKKCLRN